MHRTRQEVSGNMPIPRKGTKYIARTLSHIDSSVPVVIAMREMLKLAKTAKEVKMMIHQRLLKINGKTVKDYRESIKLFNIFEADKAYKLTLLPTGKFTFEESKSKDRLCKVINKKILSGNRIQLNLHDGTNIISKDKIAVGDSVYIDSKTKISNVVRIEKGKSALVISGKYAGSEGKIKELDGKKVVISLKSASPLINSSQVVAL